MVIFKLQNTAILARFEFMQRKNFGFSFRLGQAKSFVASCIIRPIGNFRGHDCSATLKSN